jgi:hypothetical protein
MIECKIQKVNTNQRGTYQERQEEIHKGEIGSLNYKQYIF